MTENNLEELEESELRHRYDRGDYVDPSEIRLAKKLLNKFEKDRNFKVECENASIAAALNADKRARTSNVIAVIALVVSVTSLVWQICSYTSQP